MPSALLPGSMVAVVTPITVQHYIKCKVHKINYLTNSIIEQNLNYLVMSAYVHNEYLLATGFWKTD